MADFVYGLYILFISKNDESMLFLTSVSPSTYSSFLFSRALIERRTNKITNTQFTTQTDQFSIRNLFVVLVCSTHTKTYISL
jgi:hypothetical protein